MNKVSITHLSNAHNRWLRSLQFYKQELEILRNMLYEIARKNTRDSVMKEIDHYENQFKIQVENIDQLSHDIQQNITKIGKEAEASTAGYIDGDLVSTHNALEEKFEREETIINELRATFHHFAAEWM